MREMKNKIKEVELNSTQLKADYEKSVNERARCEKEMQTNSECSEEIVKKYKCSEERKSELHEAVKHYQKAFNEVFGKETEIEQKMAKQTEELEVNKNQTHCKILNI